MAQALTQPTSISSKTTPAPVAGALVNQTGNATVRPALPNREKALQILSKSIYKELRENGYEPKQIVALASEIISLVTTDIGDASIT
jgi:hypothetical protein